MFQTKYFGLAVFFNYLCIFSFSLDQIIKCLQYHPSQDFLFFVIQQLQLKLILPSFLQDLLFPLSFALITWSRTEGPCERFSAYSWISFSNSISSNFQRIFDKERISISVFNLLTIKSLGICPVITKISTYILCNVFL